jgi:Spy/CpxP family protein refolding chaperone
VARRRIIFGAVICLLTASFVCQTLSQTPRTNPQRDQAYYERLRNMTPAQRQRELQRQIQIKIQQRLKEQKKEREQNRVQTKRESKKRLEEAIRQALGATAEQWKVIKPRLEKVQDLSEISISLLFYGSASGYGRGSGSGQRSTTNQRGSGAYAGGRSSGGNTRTAPSKPDKEILSREYGWKWYKPSDRKAPDKLTKGERLSEEILKLIEDKNSKDEEIEQKMETLRKIRQETQEQLAKAQQELREVLTYRQEATLIMMRELY